MSHLFGVLELADLRQVGQSDRFQPVVGKLIQIDVQRNLERLADPDQRRLLHDLPDLLVPVLGADVVPQRLSEAIHADVADAR